MQCRPKLERRVESLLTVEAVRGQHGDDGRGCAPSRSGVFGIVTAQRHPGERRVPTRVVVGVAAVGTGHDQHRVIACATRTDPIQHRDDVVDHPNPHRPA
ncbi:Uncharacterised protein [Mycobacterium tuberculosis]|nr:Uncharacterised protein [Mycobacterium tuberculosis]